MLPINNMNNPQQVYEIFGDIIFNSCFDSGNLGKVQRVSAFKVKKRILKLVF